MSTKKITINLFEIKFIIFLLFWIVIFFLIQVFFDLNSPERLTDLHFPNNPEQFIIFKVLHLACYEIKLDASKKIGYSIVTICLSFLIIEKIYKPLSVGNFTLEYFIKEIKSNNDQKPIRVIEIWSSLLLSNSDDNLYPELKLDYAIYKKFKDEIKKRNNFLQVQFLLLDPREETAIKEREQELDGEYDIELSINRNIYYANKLNEELNQASNEKRKKANEDPENNEELNQGQIKPLEIKFYKSHPSLALYFCASRIHLTFFSPSSGKSSIEEDFISPEDQGEVDFFSQEYFDNYWDQKLPDLHQLSKIDLSVNREGESSETIEIKDINYITQSREGYEPYAYWILINAKDHQKLGDLNSYSYRLELNSQGQQQENSGNFKLVDCQTLDDLTNKDRDRIIKLFKAKYGKNSTEANPIYLLSSKDEPT